MIDGGPLSGMTIIDISQQLPGPYATELLADLGASVVKVEPPSGDPSRTLDPEMYTLINRGKRVLNLDLKQTDGVEQLHRLVAGADVFLEGFRPGVANRLGAGWPTLSRLNPRLIYCSVSAAGQVGPLAQIPMHDLNLQGLAGIDPGGAGIGIPWVDLGTATAAALAIVAAWHSAQQSGQGVVLDTAMLDVAVLWGRVKASASGRIEPTYGIFPTADGHSVAVAILENHMWSRLCKALEWEDWRVDPSFATYAQRVSRAAIVARRLANECAARELTELVDLAAEYDLPMTPAGTQIGEAAQEQLIGRALDAGSGRRVPLPLVARATHCGQDTT